MDWDGIIERNAERLVAVLTELFAMAGFGRGGTALMPRHVCRAVLALLRPAESALRRLIVIAARGIVVKLRNGGVARAFPKGTAFERDTERVAAFCLIDPLKRFAPQWFEGSCRAAGHGAGHGRAFPFPASSIRSSLPQGPFRSCGLTRRTATSSPPMRCAAA